LIGNVIHAQPFIDYYGVLIIIGGEFGNKWVAAAVAYFTILGVPSP
jgi:hypothetical protein